MAEAPLLFKAGILVSDRPKLGTHRVLLTARDDQGRKRGIRIPDVNWRD